MILVLALFLTSCAKEVSNVSHKTRDLVYPDVRVYTVETQAAVREELIEQKCLPDSQGFVDCKIPNIYAWLIDYYKMREQTRIAVADHQANASQ